MVEKGDDSQRIAQSEDMYGDWKSYGGMGCMLSGKGYVQGFL